MIPTTDARPIVSMRGIDVLFGGVHAVDTVDLDLYPGQVVALLGHNGAGKSTLAGVLAGSIVRDAGDIEIDGKPVHINSPRSAREVGVETIYQTLALAGNLDAATNIFLGRELRQWIFFRRKAEMRAQAAEVLHRINPHFKNIDNLVHTFSGGQRQSIAIARAVLFKARVLILDEPTAALGPSETMLFKELIKNLRAEGVAILLISHDINDVFDLADKLVVMSDGKVVGRLNTHEATKEQVLSLIILGGGEPGAAPLVLQEAERTAAEALVAAEVTADRVHQSPDDPERRSPNAN
jgi:D-xylose transport system ATP-binding protein